MVRLLLGIVKGALIGAAVGFGAYQAGLDGGWGYVVYGAIGFAVGLFVGRPVWSHLLDKQSTVWTSVLKGIFGLGVGIGLFALAHYVLHDPTIHLGAVSHPLTDWSHVFGGVVGALYGAFLELDDAPPAPEPTAGDGKDKAKAKSR